jgi:hypothetical protein
MEDPNLCAQCKGSRRLCGKPRCPLLARVKVAESIFPKMKETMFGASPPSLLVGEWGYPRVRIGPNVPPVLGDDSMIYDNPQDWWGNQSLDELIKLRASLVHSKFSIGVDTKSWQRATSRNKGLLEKTQELAMSIKPVDTEVNFFKAPKPRLEFDGIVKPVGPTATIKNFQLTSNPSVPSKVDYLVYDTDALSITAIQELYNSNTSVYDIIRLLTVGLLGRKKQRKLVPTRWGITAVDANLGKLLIEKVKDFPQISEIQLYTSDYLDNHYETLLLPGEWSFEMIEIWLPRTVWAQGEEAHITDVWEKYNGKVSAMDGGYYCMRLPALEHLEKIRRQATIISFREVGAGYTAPLGNWHIRESVKHSFDSKPRTFPTIEAALADISTRIQTPLQQWWRSSTVLKDWKYQKKLTQFM